MYKLLVIISLLIGLAFGQTFPRPCPNHQIHTPFIPASYAGNWYEIRRYDTATQAGGDCTFSVYSMYSNMIFNVEYSMLMNLETAPALEVINGQSWVSFPEESPLTARMNLTFFGPPQNSNYWILSTDYVNYSVVWFCEELSATLSSERAWILSRTPQLNPSVQGIVDNIVNTYLDDGYFQTTIQDARCTNRATDDMV